MLLVFVFSVFIILFVFLVFLFSFYYLICLLFWCLFLLYYRYFLYCSFMIWLFFLFSFFVVFFVITTQRFVLTNQPSHLTRSSQNTKSTRQKNPHGLLSQNVELLTSFAARRFGHFRIRYVYTKIHNAKTCFCGRYGLHVS